MVLRWSYVDLNDAEIRGGRERNITAGLNWYLFPRTRVMINYIRAKLLGSEAPGVWNGNADIVMIRMQFGF